MSCRSRSRSPARPDNRLASSCSGRGRASSANRSPTSSSATSRKIARRRSTATPRSNTAASSLKNSRAPSATSRPPPTRWPRRSWTAPGRTSPRSRSAPTPAGFTHGSPTPPTSARTPPCPRASPPTRTAWPSAYAVTQYLVALAGKPLDVYKLPTVVPNPIKQSMERGRILYTVTGCAACHSDPLPKKKKGEEDDKEPLAPADFIYGVATLSGPTPKYNLGGVGSKFRPETLAAYLQNPLKTNPHGRMPNMNLSSADATDIARYLCRVPAESVTPDALPKPKLAAAEVAKSVFAAATDADKKRFAGLKSDAQWVELGARVTRGQRLPQLPHRRSRRQGPPAARHLPGAGRHQSGRGEGVHRREAGPDEGAGLQPRPAGARGARRVRQGRPRRGRVAGAGVPGAGRAPPLQLPQLPPAGRRGRHPGRTRRPDAAARKDRERRRRAAAGAHRRPATRRARAG